MMPQSATLNSFANKSAAFRNQFLMSKANAMAPQNKYEASPDFQTSNSFYQRMTANSQMVHKQTAQVNPVLAQLSPETFEVAAKKRSSIWKTAQYTEPEFRETLMQTKTRQDQGQLPDFELTESMREKRFNNHATEISEYSNALNRGRVFTNPKFSSC